MVSADFFYYSATIALWLIVIFLGIVTVTVYRLATRIHHKIDRLGVNLVTGVINSLIRNILGKRRGGGQDE